jgi:hypothetical protein
MPRFSPFRATGNRKKSNQVVSNQFQEAGARIQERGGPGRASVQLACPQTYFALARSGSRLLREFADMHAQRQIPLGLLARSKAAPRRRALTTQRLLTPGFWLLAPTLILPYLITDYFQATYLRLRCGQR